MFYSVLKIILRILFKIFLRLEVKGAENIPATGPFGNCQQSFKFAGSACNRCSIYKKSALYGKTGVVCTCFGDIYKLLGAFPVKRGGADRTAIKHGIDLMLDGGVLAIFPEGTRSKTGALGKAEPGALMMAGKAKAVIVPTCVKGTDIKRQGKLWPQVNVKFWKTYFFSLRMYRSAKNCCMNLQKL